MHGWLPKAEKIKDGTVVFDFTSTLYCDFGDVKTVPVNGYPDIHLLRGGYGIVWHCPIKCNIEDIHAISATIIEYLANLNEDLG